MELIEYLIKACPLDFLSVLHYFGSRLQPADPRGMAREAAHLARLHGARFIAACYSIHPDREIIREMQQEEKKFECPLKKIPDGLLKFYSGSHRNLKLLGTAALLVFIIRKL